MFLASRGVLTSKLLPESAKPWGTQQQHLRDQRIKDAQAIELSAKLKTHSVVPSFKQKLLRFSVIERPPEIQRDIQKREEQSDVEIREKKRNVQIREEQRLEDEDDGGDELIMDALMGDACGDDEALEVRMTYQEFLDDVNKKLAKNKDTYMSRIVADLHLLRQFTQQLLKLKPYRLGKIEASLLVARSNHHSNDGHTLARRIRGLLNYYRQWHSCPQESRGGKRRGASYLDNEDVFLACRAWLINQELGTVSPNDFLNAVNQEILPRLLTVMDKPIARSTIYLWLPRLGFHRHETKKGV